MGTYIAVVACMALVLGYILSLRPICWMMHHGYFPHGLYTLIYWPLFWLADRVPALGAFVVRLVVDL
jgi:hypothetical protein